MQHRPYQAPHTGGVANGHLVKRWTNQLVSDANHLTAVLLECE
jgi:hypothetical protein